MARSTEKTIFLEATEFPDAAQRAAYLDSACGDDENLRAAVEKLLSAHERPANPLDQLPVGNSSAEVSVDKALAGTVIFDDDDGTEHVGTMIGDYRLMEQIGEGGFGLVYVAQQSKPVKRKVALKIIKPGTGSKEVLARFAAERQAVAMMDHPNIAQVFDAGVTDDERPYFVMELVRGEPVTDFCDRHQLSLRERLDIFQDVCAATHHAHQKGVIHRDLKPANVMVTLHDDRPVVKVIDFGVAKAMGDNLADETIYTRFYSMIGTPLYMSPEQAAMSGLDVDTRSDLYSLGVLLYQLLTGTTPFERERLDSAGYDEMRRIIREEEPPRPSTRLTTLRNSQLATVSAGATKSDSHQAFRQLHESIPVDLDWIVMKALEKDRTRRYESAAAMSADVRRFLKDEPIEARPPSRWYRLAKFAHRNRVALLAGSMVLSALVLGTVISVYQASQAIHERNEKEFALQEAIDAKQKVEAFAGNLKTANVLLARARAYENENEFAQADAAYSEAVELVPNYYMVWHRRATLRAELYLWVEAAEDFSQAIQLEAPVEDRQWQGASALFFLTGRDEDYRTIYSRLITSVGLRNVEAWHAIRSCLIAPQSDEDAQQLAAAVEKMMEQPDGPPGRGREFEYGGPARGGGQIFGPGRGPDGPPGGPWRRDRPAGRVDNGPGGPGFLRRLPRSVEQYIAAWAHIRAGNHERALEYLDAAADSRGAVGRLLPSLRAIALHHLGRTDESVAALLQANEGMDELIEDFLSASATEKPGPSMDLTDGVILHREATQLVTGQLAEIDSRLRIAQFDTRKLLGIE